MSEETEGYLEEIGKGHKEWKLLGFTFKETPDELMISNRMNFIDYFLKHPRKITRWTSWALIIIFYIICFILKSILLIALGIITIGIFLLVTGHKQLGKFKVSRPHDFKEGDSLIVTMKNGEIVGVRKI